jgi:hypothetical protein
MLLALACSLPLAADEVTLKSGGKFAGVVEERGDKVVVRTEHGTMTFDRSQVAGIDRSKGSTLQEYQERAGKTDLSKAGEVEALLAWAQARRMSEPVKELRERLCRLKFDALDLSDDGALARFVAWARTNGCGEAADVALRGGLGIRRAKLEGKDAEGRYRLGLWAKTNGLAADAVVLFHEAISADADHEHARRALGYQKHQGQWVTERELKTLLGLIEFEGDWMTPATKEAIVTSRTLEKERKLLEDERRRLEEQRVLARQEHAGRLAELDARAAALARQAAEIERRAREVAAWSVHAPCGMPDCRTLVPHVHCLASGCRRGDPHRH